MQITIVAGARPNFVKIAPIIRQITQKQKEGENIDYKWVHTGQHYDKNLSDTFFEELKIPKPHTNLEIGSGTQAEQTAGIMIAFEKYMMQNPTDIVVVVGDVNSTMACAIVAKKMKIRVAHVEGGIRSFDLSMPEEINRIITDSISDYFYVTSDKAIQNLKKNGVSNKRIVFVGNTMIDTLVANMDRLKAPKIFEELELKNKKYLVLTIHRPANVDEEIKLKFLLETIVDASKSNFVIFPTHPRTKAVLSKLKISYDNLINIEPLGYLEFNYLVKNACCVITDSGGVTEESTFLKIPCLTLRNNTERPETVSIGTNELLGTDQKAIKKALNKIFEGNWKKGKIPKLWDGKTSQRIVDHLFNI